MSDERFSYFNRRSPRGERQFSLAICRSVLVFQSTLPAGGATPARISYSCGAEYFNPRSPRGERLVQESIKIKLANISIHAPRGGSDWTPSAKTNKNNDFNPRSPRGERQTGGGTMNAEELISIHAPRGGSDCTVKACSNDRIKRSTLREPHFLYSKNACFSPIFSMCATTSRTKNHRIIVSFGSYPGLAPMCFTLDWYRFPRL